MAPKGFVRSSSQYGCRSNPGLLDAETTPAPSPLAGIQQAPSLAIGFLSLVRAPSASPRPRDALSYLHVAKGLHQIPSGSPSANHDGGEGMGEIRPGASKTEQPHRPAQCAERAGGRQAAAGLLTAGHGRSLTAQGNARPVRALRGTQQAAGPEPGVRCWPREPLPPQPGLPWGSALCARRPRRPARPSRPSPSADPPSPAAAAPTAVALPQPRCGPATGRQVSRRCGARGRGVPGTQAPQREQRPPRAAGRRSAAPSRSGQTPHRGPRRADGRNAGGRARPRVSGGGGGCSARGKRLQLAPMPPWTATV